MLTIIHQYNSKFHDSRKCIFVPVQKSQSDNIESDKPMGIAKQSTDSENVSDHSCQWHQEHSESISISCIVGVLISAECIQNYENTDQNSFTFVKVHTICTNVAMHSSRIRCITRF